MSEVKNRAVRSIFKGGGIVLLGTFVSKLLGLAYRVLVGRGLGPADYGVISVMMSVFSASLTLAFMGIPNGVQRYLAYFRGEGDEEGMRGAVRTGLKLITIPSFLVAVTLYALAPWLSSTVFNEPNALWPIRMVAVIVPLRAYTVVFTRVTTAFERMEFEVLTGKIWINVVKIVVAGVLVWLGYGYMGAAFGYAFAFGSAVFVAYCFATRVFPGFLSPRKSSRHIHGELFQHSWPLMMGGVFGIITGHIDTFMLQSFLGSEKVGLYQAAYPFAMLMTVAAGMFGSITLSNVSRLVSEGGTEALTATYRVVTKWISVLTVPLFAVVMAFPRAVLKLFGSEYYAVDSVLRVLAIGFFLRTITGPSGTLYQAVERTRLNLVTSVTVAVVNGGLNYVLIPVLGVMGAAIASTAGFTVVFLIDIALIVYLLGRQPFRWSVLKTWLAAAVAILAVYGMTNVLFTVTPLWFFFVDLVVFCVIYAGLVLVLRTIDEEDLVVLRSIREKFGISVEWMEDLIRRFS